jgi:hypothetical protein
MLYESTEVWSTVPGVAAFEFENRPLWERHLLAAVAFSEGWLSRLSWLEATPKKTRLAII